MFNVIFTYYIYLPFRNKIKSMRKHLRNPFISIYLSKEHEKYSVSLFIMFKDNYIILLYFNQLQKKRKGSIFNDNILYVPPIT